MAFNAFFGAGTMMAVGKLEESYGRDNKSALTLFLINPTEGSEERLWEIDRLHNMPCK